jgi:hypothetical protein
MNCISVIVVRQAKLVFIKNCPQKLKESERFHCFNASAGSLINQQRTKGI